jgi:hypothetical protein
MIARFELSGWKGACNCLPENENDSIMASQVDQLLDHSVRSSTTSSEKLRYELANLSLGGNERSHCHCSAELAFSAAVSFGICAVANFPFGSRQGIRIGGTDFSVVMIRNFNPFRPTSTTSGQSRTRLRALTA